MKGKTLVITFILYHMQTMETKTETERLKKQGT